MEVKIKPKKCKSCGKDFKPFNSIQKYCSYVCTEKGEKERKSTKESKKTVKKEVSRKDLLRLARITFNSFIRERDKNKVFCICCDQKLNKDYQAGHYYSGGGHSNVLFDEENVNAQRMECNIYKAGNINEYGVRLEEKLGSVAFAMLRERAYTPKHWTSEELKKIIQDYKQKIKELKNA